MKLLNKALKKLAKIVAEFMGSWWSVFSFLFVISNWVIFNTIAYTQQWHIDNYPYSFLNLILGVLSALTGPLVLIGNSSQERRYQKLIESIYSMEKKQNNVLESIYDMEKKQMKNQP